MRQSAVWTWMIVAGCILIGTQMVQALAVLPYHRVVSGTQMIDTRDGFSATSEKKTVETHNCNAGRSEALGRVIDTRSPLGMVMIIR